MNKKKKNRKFKYKRSFSNKILNKKLNYQNSKKYKT